MSVKNDITVNLEYGVLRACCGLVNLIPYRAAMAVAKAFGWLAFYVFRVKRTRTMERLRGVFPEKTDSELHRIARYSITNIFQTGVEMVRAPKLTRAWMDKYVKDGQLYKDKLQALIDEGRGVVIMVPHSGNWYMAAWSMAKYGLPLVSIAAKQKNPKIDAWMKRQYTDIEVFDRGSARALVDIHTRLKNGRGFAILPDLRVPQPDVEVDFLRGKANVSHAGAMFAVKCGCPIVVAVMRRENGQHVFDHLATLRPNPAAEDKKEESARLTREAMTLISEKVLLHPEHWFWYNKRWILQPVKTKGDTK